MALRPRSSLHKDLVFKEPAMHVGLLMAEVKAWLLATGVAKALQVEALETFSSHHLWPLLTLGQTLNKVKPISNGVEVKAMEDKARGTSRATGVNRMPHKPQNSSNHNHKWAPSLNLRIPVRIASSQVTVLEVP